MTEDRFVSVPPGYLIATAYVPVFNCELTSRVRMAVGDVGAAYQKVLRLGDHQQWPPPFGHWKDGKFFIDDGRHQWVASVMLGQEFIFVCWLSKLG